MPDARAVLEEYVQSGTLMQLASLSSDGAPVVCNVWYNVHFAPDVLRFISRCDRNHCQNIRADGRVAGSIIAIQMEGLGRKVRGVTYTGTARELPTEGIDEQAAAFVARWPRAEPSLDPGKLARGETMTRLYEISVAEWVLFDDTNFPEQPRQVVKAVL